MTHGNHMKVTCQCPQMRFHWRMAKAIHSHIDGRVGSLRFTIWSFKGPLPRPAARFLGILKHSAGFLRLNKRAALLSICRKMYNTYVSQIKNNLCYKDFLNPWDRLCVLCWQTARTTKCTLCKVRVTGEPRSSSSR